MVFMGEEVGSRAPFLYFTDHDEKLAAMVREGRRREFAAFGDVVGHLPDPNALSTFEASDPFSDAPDSETWRDFYQSLLSLRRDRIIPYLAYAEAIDAAAVGSKAVIARWQLGTGKTLIIACNLDDRPAEAVLPSHIPLWGIPSEDTLPPFATLAWIIDA
jgi:maltooligosyltrehalose trehalohydrolase